MITNNWFIKISANPILLDKAKSSKWRGWFNQGMHHAGVDPMGAAYLSILGSGSFHEKQVCFQQYVIHLRKCDIFRHASYGLCEWCFLRLSVHSQCITIHSSPECSGMSLSHLKWPTKLSTGSEKEKCITEYGYK